MRTAAPAGSRASSDAAPKRVPVLGRRKATRAPLLTQVEAQAEHSSCLGRARDISVGGLLIETPETLPENSSVIVRFLIPPERNPLEAAGRVVRVEPGRSMAIAFLGLPENHKKKILDYIRRMETVAAENLCPSPGQGQPRVRRSGRINRRLPVLLSWQDEQGRTHHEAAETQRLSKHGTQVLSFAEIQPGWLVRVAVPELGKEGQSRVVWTEPADVAGRVKLGLEFLGTDDFWGVEFPPDLVDPGLTALHDRRRTPRLPRRVDVSVNWIDNTGTVRQETVQTRDLSHYGAQLASPVPFEVGQRIRLQTHEPDRAVESRVVWARPGEVPGSTYLGVEFTQPIDFWGITFPSVLPAA